MNFQIKMIFKTIDLEVSFKYHFLVKEYLDCSKNTLECTVNQR
ncbi:hypothetical protein [Clostridium botulinum]|nr:hypothetical protein [Clostridium botulinum]AEB77609.1 hypothetical protein CbC4_6090 [Clostridium botulinum BKT015925]